MAVVEPVALRRLATSKPVMPGIEMSRTTTSGVSAAMASSAAAPSLAEPTISQPGESTETARAIMAGLSSTSRTRGCSDNVMLDGILNELGRGFDFQLFHHSIFVKGDGPRRQIQNRRDFLHRSPFRQQLQHFALPRRELLRRSAFPSVQQRAHQ